MTFRELYGSVATMVNCGHVEEHGDVAGTDFGGGFFVQQKSKQKILTVPAKMVDFFPKDQLIINPVVLSQVLRYCKEHGQYQERELVENDPAWRQPIPYVLVTTRVGGERKFVLMRRLKGQGEARLLGKHYIGAGGHVEDGHSINYTALKEVTEELGLPLMHLDPMGVLITTGGMVEDVHLCIFYEAETLYTTFDSPEANTVQAARWVDRKNLAVLVPEMEKWSQVIAKQYLVL